MFNPIPIPVKGQINGELEVNANAIQEIIILQFGTKFKITLTLFSGRTYNLVDNHNNEIFNTKLEAENFRDALKQAIANLPGAPGGDNETIEAIEDALWWDEYFNE